jgi:hypothetical protein
MTSQRDPDGRRRRTEYIRRDDGTWNTGGLIVGLAAIAVVVVLFLSFAGDRHPDRAATSTGTTTTTQPKTTPNPTNPTTPGKTQ